MINIKNFVKRKVKMKEKIEVNKFKKLILDMYRGFPSYRYFNNMVEQVIKTEEDRNRLIKHGFLVKEKTGKRDQYKYSLGPNALLLVNSWKMEKLTNRILSLTTAMIVLVIIQIALYIINYIP